MSELRGQVRTEVRTRSRPRKPSIDSYLLVLFLGVSEVRTSKFFLELARFRGALRPCTGGAPEGPAGQFLLRLEKGLPTPCILVESVCKADQQQFRRSFHADLLLFLEASRQCGGCLGSSCAFEDMARNIGAYPSARRCHQTQVGDDNRGIGGHAPVAA